jgi:hypothetical protein
VGCNSERRQFLGPRLELRQQLLDVARRRLKELALDRLAWHRAAAVTQRAVEKFERADEKGCRAAFRGWRGAARPSEIGTTWKRFAAKINSGY